MIVDGLSHSAIYDAALRFDNPTPLCPIDKRACQRGIVMSAEQKVAVITGASQGIGAELVRAFLGRGYRVVANSRSIGRTIVPTCSRWRGYYGAGGGGAGGFGGGREVWAGRYAREQRGDLYWEAVYRVHRGRLRAEDFGEPGRVLLCVAASGAADAHAGWRALGKEQKRGARSEAESFGRLGSLRMTDDLAPSGRHFMEGARS